MTWHKQQQKKIQSAFSSHKQGVFGNFILSIIDQPRKSHILALNIGMCVPPTHSCCFLDAHPM